MISCRGMNKHFLIILAVMLVGWAIRDATASDEDAFLKARQAYYGQDTKEFEYQAGRIERGYPLYPYIEYWRISRDLTAAGDGAIADFLASHPGTLLAEKLRADWLKELGRREFWPAFLPEYPRLIDPDTVLQCYARRAELAAGNLSNLRAAVALWFTGNDQPSPCTPLFLQLISQGYLSQEDIWRRFRLALMTGNAGVAKSLLAMLPAESRPAMSEIDDAGRDADRFLHGNRVFARRADRELVIYALAVLAKVDPDQAAQMLQSRGPLLPEQDRRVAWGEIAYWAASFHHPQTLVWFERAGTAALTDPEREWWVRAALRAGQWRTVLDVINSMSAENQNQPVWRYWKARALSQTGQVTSANMLFASLAGEYDFYGLLAAEELGQVVGNTVANVIVSGDEIQKKAEAPAIVRALALYNLGLRSEATEEWKWAIRDDDDRQLLAAAQIASQHQWFDRAIMTAEKTRQQHNFDLRFLAPYRDQATEFARKYNLDEAWVYGVIRQESRFISEAQSGTGAMGLMQIMPATAHWIANKLGVSGFRNRDAGNPGTNIKFGAYYLRSLLDSMENQPVLATASYNAGPRRAQRWRDEQPMEAAVYIESIPYPETRDYVKKVMSNAMFYAARFGQPSLLLKERLGVIPGRRQSAPVAAGLEDKSPGSQGGSGGS